LKICLRFSQRLLIGTFLKVRIFKLDVVVFPKANGAMAKVPGAGTGSV
jgi:hypothetical protein